MPTWDWIKNEDVINEITDKTDATPSGIGRTTTTCERKMNVWTDGNYTGFVTSRKKIKVDHKIICK